MSETDDTDVLLLIPPNFFLVFSSESEDSLLESSRTVVHKPLSCTAQALGKLFNQVNTLESRLDSLELDGRTLSSVSSLRHKTWDTDSFESRSLDRKYSTFPRVRRRKLGRKKSTDLSVTSFVSVSSRPKSIPALNLKDNTRNKVETVNDSQSMDGDISSIGSTPSKKNDKLLLHEIDEFLNKVECYETPDTKIKSQDEISPDNVIKAAGDYFTQKLDSKSTSEDIRLPSGRMLPSDVLDKYIYLVRNQGVVTQPNCALQSNTSRTEKTVNSSSTNHIKDLKSPSMRRLNFSENKDVNTTSTPKRLTQASMNNNEPFKPSSNKIYERASKVLEHYKSKNYSTQASVTDSDLQSLRKEEFRMPQIRPFDSDNKEGMRLAAVQMDSIDTDLLSLSELWGEKGDKERTESLKLEEERLKREHCESIIQQLQRKMLEQQEKLAVAMKVDRAKDSAIAKLREAWLKLTGSLDRAEERHRAALEKMVHEVENFKMVAGEAQKKTNHFETELYKALDLAHDYQEKCKLLTAEKTELQGTVEKTIMDKEEAIKSKEKEIETLKESYDTVIRLNKQSTDCVKSLEDSIEKERLDHDSTRSKLSELNTKMQSLTDEMSLVQQEKDILKDKVNEERARCNVLERQLADMQNQSSELLKKYDAVDTENKSLRKHLEVQKSELKSHYQRQLEEAVLGKLQEFQRQLDLAERELEGRARSREAALGDGYSKQMARVEEQHKLEVEVLEEKQKEEIKLYRLQLAQANEKIGLLESKLESYRRRRGQIASQLHGVMEAQWRQALLILTQGHPGQPGHPPGHARPSGLDLDPPRDGAATPFAHDYAPPKVPPLTMPAFADRGLLRPDERRGAELRDYNFEGLSDHELQQYVRLLLTKPANFNVEEEDRGLEFEEPTSDRPERPERRDRAKRSLNTNKPPWKA